jgi:preprotein translocase subunit SecE
LARAPVSKTGGWGFETLHPCQVVAGAAAKIPLQPFYPKEDTRVAFAPAKFVRDVRAEAAKVTWPSRRETGITTLMVVIMAVLTAIFFLLVDQVIGFAVRQLFAGTT